MLVMVQACNPSILEAEAGRLGGQGLLELQSESGGISRGKLWVRIMGVEEEKSLNI